MIVFYFSCAALVGIQSVSYLDLMACNILKMIIRMPRKSFLVLCSSRPTNGQAKPRNHMNMLFKANPRQPKSRQSQSMLEQMLVIYPWIIQGQWQRRLKNNDFMLTGSHHCHISIQLIRWTEKMDILKLKTHCRTIYPSKTQISLASGNFLFLATI